MLKKLGGIAAALALIIPAHLPAASAAETDIKFMLDFISLGRHAPWYVALEKGYFKEESLNVEILPSKGTADAIRGVVTGLAPIGLIDVPSLVASGKAGGDIKIVAAAYVEAPYCVYSLKPGANVTRPAQLEGLKFGSSSASFIPQIWRAFMNMNHLDGSKLEVVNIDAAARVPMLAAGQVDGIDQFLMAAPAIRRAAPGKEAVCLFAADYGLDLYSNSIGVNKSFLDHNPETVRGFVRAAIRGWQYALAHRDEAAAIMVKRVPALDRSIVRDEIDLLERIAINADVRTNGFGHISPEKFAKTFAFINSNVQVTGSKLEADQVYEPGFTPKPPILPE
ncbi:ABC transporter substrate-binding protein [Bradyrhizobium sp. CCBAU 53338]|uniref:ABC transporter substrate-binding protein n=1 Tax=Bradyrhizobium sp. CCBAU 53338 TaxID=1325111 RepID=UPI00188BFE37|nr:ABC transporter substrate-binding protein [Bradyrhizobium sp. CCBAU 53338]QOZ52527.1 hypothetical protein XH90_14950 [Bradyrhizobium sp. CCBAU 53338]